MDRARSRFRDAVKDAGLDYQQLSLGAGKNRTYLQQYVTKGLPRYLPVHVAQYACERIGLDWRDYVHPRDAAVMTTGGNPVRGPDRHAGEEAHHSTESVVCIDEVDVRVSAGGGSLVEYKADSGLSMRRWCLPRDVFRGLDTEEDAARILKVEGDSMEPLLHHGDYVLVDTKRKMPSPPGIFVLWDGMGVVVKRVEYLPTRNVLRISSANPAYEAYERTAEEALIHGRVVWMARNI